MLLLASPRTKSVKIAILFDGNFPQELLAKKTSSKRVFAQNQLSTLQNFKNVIRGVSLGSELVPFYF